MARDGGRRWREAGRQAGRQAGQAGQAGRQGRQGRQAGQAGQAGLRFLHVNNDGWHVGMEQAGRRVEGCRRESAQCRGPSSR
jgi:hypothetical protein